jgi:hypothetical protein
MAEGNPTIAIAVATLLLLVSVGGAGYYFANNFPDTKPQDNDEENKTAEPTEPETPPPVIECANNQREIFGDNLSIVIGCVDIIPPSNASFESDSIQVTLGSITELNWSIDGDNSQELEQTFEIQINCSDSAAQLRQSQEQDGADWIITAIEIGTSICDVNVSNHGGSTNLSIEIIVVDTAPFSLSYLPATHVLTKDEPFTIFPYYEQGEPTSWESNPPMPPGLELRDDGAIIGAPNTLMPATTYTITASNVGGSDSTNFTISVHDQAPTLITYLEDELILTIGEQMNDMIPNHGGGDVLGWEVDPPLPSGLDFSQVSGRISGTPTTLYERSSHIVYANNSGGYAAIILQITVNDKTVESIDYGSQDFDLVFGYSTLNITPITNGGNPVNWSIEPPLALGLQFDLQFGTIYGDADEITPWVNHTIWANNSGGSFSTWLNIRIANMTPENISWLGGNEHVLAANQSITISAINGGPTIDSWEVSPPLPHGLSLGIDGTIAGLPIGRDGVNTSRHAWTIHTIWANNSGGSLETNLTFAIHDLAQDHNELVKRPVGSVDFGGAWPSLILPIGEWAFSLGIDWDDRPISSAGHAGKGRIVGYGHETMVARTGNDARANLSLNALDWVCDGNGKTVGLESSFNGWQNTLLAEGYAVVTSATPADLANLDCFVTEFWNSYSDAENLVITTWLEEGGGMIMGGHAWYWSYSNSDAAHNYPGNKISKTTGLFVSTSSGSSTFGVNTNEWGDLYRLHGALPLIVDHVDGTQMMTQNDATIGAITVSLCVSNLPLDYTGVWDSLRKMSNDTGWIHIDSNNQYTMNADEVDDLILNIQEQLMLKLPADEVDSHPSHSSFPGQVNATAPRPKITVNINGTFAGLPSQFGYANARAAGRMATGMYAPAGEVVNITIPQSMVNQGAAILVGAHSDSLWGKSSLSRHPKITRGWTMSNTSIQVANAFGGPIYVTIPAGSAFGEFNITIENAVEMPRYIHGQTDINNWQNTIRNNSAPIAELESEWFILTVPSSYIRNLDYPNETMDFWDDALQMEHNLSGYTPWPRVERSVFDVQISAGWMHSGYPFMAHTASVSGVVNGSYMRANGDWGMFHELGHNHQWMSSTLPGTTETTCNLYSVKLMTDLVGKDLRAGHSALNTQSMINRVETYFSGGSQISQWSVWTALETYLQIQEEFGWEPITAAYQEYYYNLTTQPSGDSAEFNEYAKWISIKTGHNMTSFLAAWGFPIAEPTQNAVDHLPVWTTDPLRGWVNEYDPETRNEMTSNITTSKADVDWMVYDNGTNTTWQLCWGVADGGVVQGNWDFCEYVGSNLSVGGNSHPLSGLFPSTDYYWRLTAENGNGRWWDDSTRQFTTP